LDVTTIHLTEAATRSTLARKGRAVTPVTAAITDGAGQTTMTAVFEWFVQRLEAAALSGPVSEP
jgi:hypothetical protein